MKVTKILIAATLSCLLFAGCSATDTGRKEGATMEKLAALGYTNIIEFGGINDWPGEVETSEK